MSRVKTWLASNILLLLTAGGVGAGLGLGLSLRPLHLSSTMVSLIAYPGELFMRLLKLMILPLVVASLVSGAASLNAKINGKIAARTIVYFLSTSLISSLVGLLLVVTIHPGNSETKTILGSGTADSGSSPDIVDSFLDLGRNMVPGNIFRATLETAITRLVNTTGEVERVVSYREGTNTLGIIGFCLAFGTVLGSLGEAGRLLVELFRIVDEVIMRLVMVIMYISPIGIASIIAAKILAVADIAVVMSQLGMFILTAVSGVFLYQFVILQLIYLLIVRANPLRFWFGLAQAWVTAWATASTAAALPVTFRCMKENNKVDERISKFVLPIGATVNMDGTALFVTVASIFIAQLNDIPLGAGDYATVVVTATAVSVAAASVPSAALVLLILVLTAIDCPVADVSLLWTVDWFVDRCRTTNNMLGDCYGAAVVETLSRAELRRMDSISSEKDKREGQEMSKMNENV